MSGVVGLRHWHAPGGWTVQAWGLSMLLGWFGWVWSGDGLVGRHCLRWVGIRVGLG